MSEDAIEREVQGLHKFFEDWFTGRAAKTDEAYSRFRAVLAPDFFIIFPDGRMLERDEVLASVWDQHGRSSENPRYFRIWVDEVRVRRAEPGAAAAADSDVAGTVADTVPCVTSLPLRQRHGGARAKLSFGAAAMRRIARRGPAQAARRRWPVGARHRRCRRWPRAVVCLRRRPRGRSRSTATGSARSAAAPRRPARTSPGARRRRISKGRRGEGGSKTR